MVASARGSVIVVAFPFSDLSQFKLRPAVVLNSVDRGDWILCQVTSRTYADAHAVELTSGDFLRGSLRVTSYARPGKLFTAHNSLMRGEVGLLKKTVLDRLVEAVIQLIRAGA